LCGFIFFLLHAFFSFLTETNPARTAATATMMMMIMMMIIMMIMMMIVVTDQRKHCIDCSLQPPDFNV
jgi:hypothetical protein